MAVLSTGDELVPAETARLEPGRIRDANRPMLLAAGVAPQRILTRTRGAPTYQNGSRNALVDRQPESALRCNRQ